MPRRKLPYNEGDWFAVPLGCGGYALGIAARADGRHGIIGYFYSPRYECLPTLDDVGTRRPEYAILVAMLGDLGLREGRWKVLGRRDPWDRSAWPMPVFGQYHGIPTPAWFNIYRPQAWLITYSEANLVEPVKIERTSYDVARSHPRDGIMGDVSVENTLSRLLCPA